MTEELDAIPELLLDFNGPWSDDGFLLTTTADGIEVEQGQQVLLSDAEGNSCFGTVAGLETGARGGLVKVEPDYESWRSGPDSDFRTSATRIADSIARKKGDPLGRYLLLVHHQGYVQTWSDSDDLDVLVTYAKAFLLPTAEYKILDIHNAIEVALDAV